MQTKEVDAGDFRILAAAQESVEAGGYVASVVVLRQPGAQEAWRDERLAGGFAWATPNEALRFAINTGRDRVMCQAQA